MLEAPKVGQVWERDGKRRTVLQVDGAGSQFGYTVVWRRGKTESVAWCTTWSDWARKATLVDVDAELRALGFEDQQAVARMWDDARAVHDGIAVEAPASNVAQDGKVPEPEVQDHGTAVDHPADAT